MKITPIGFRGKRKPSLSVFDMHSLRSKVPLPSGVIVRQCQNGSLFGWALVELGFLPSILNVLLVLLLIYGLFARPTLIRTTDTDVQEEREHQSFSSAKLLYFLFSHAHALSSYSLP